MSQGQAGFFDTHQRDTIEAAMARVIPSGEQPGAREAGTIDFLDRYLSGIGYIYARPDGSGFEKLEGKQAEAWRQRISVIQAKYVEGVRQLDRRSQDRFRANFIGLNEEQQDQVLADLERPELQTERALSEAQATTAWAPVEPAMQQTSAEVDLDFFPLLTLHTRQGFYSDPIYGGNRDRVGWRLIGFEGPASLAETHAGLFTTLPYFAENSVGSTKEDERGVQE